MRKLILMVFLFPLIANASYQRNVARPVNEVKFGQVETIRYISQEEMVEAQGVGWKTLLGAVVGGIVGHQFGGGHGKQVATVVGAAAGGAITHQSVNKTQRLNHQLVELLIRTKKDELIDVIQDVEHTLNEACSKVEQLIDIAKRSDVKPEFYENKINQIPV